MTASHPVTRGTRYHYYVSRRLITKDQTESSAGLRIPAAEIEHIVTSRMRQWLLDPGGIYRATSERLPDPSLQQRLVARAGEMQRHCGRRHRPPDIENSKILVGDFNLFWLSDAPLTLICLLGQLDCPYPELLSSSAAESPEIEGTPRILAQPV